MIHYRIQKPFCEIGEWWALSQEEVGTLLTFSFIELYKTEFDEASGWWTHYYIRSE